MRHPRRHSDSRDILVVRDGTASTASITGGSLGLAERVYSLDAPLLGATTANTSTQEGGRSVPLAGARDCSESNQA